MGDTLPRVTFFTPEVQATFGNYLTTVLFMVMPLVLIWLATEYGSLLIGVIRDAFSRMNGRESDYDDEGERD